MSVVAIASRMNDPVRISSGNIGNEVRCEGETPKSLLVQHKFRVKFKQS
jgi:hypothetical protein